MDYRRKVQVVFQDPYSSLSPRMQRRGHHRASPSRPMSQLSRREMRARVGRTVRAGRSADPIWPVSFRTSSAAGSASAWLLRGRSSTNARLVVLDEPVSALDVSISRPHHWPPGDAASSAWASATCLSPTIWRRSSHLSHQIAVMYLGQDRGGGREPRAAVPSRCTLYQGPVCRLAALAPRRGEGGDRPQRRGAQRSQSAVRAATSTPVVPSPCRSVR